MTGIHFGMHHEYRLPVYQVTDQQYEVLADWIVNDIETYFGAVLTVLALVDDLARGWEPFDDLGSDQYEVSFTSDVLRIQQCWPNGTAGEYPVDLVRTTMEDYWRFLVALPERDSIREYRPDLPEWQATLMRWEEKRGRAHPYRGRLF